MVSLKLFHFCTLLIALTSLTASAKKYPGIHYGGYSIVNCSPGNQTHLTTLLTTLNTALLPTIRDAESKHPSTAYSTFFNDVYYATFVADILTKVTKGVAMGTTETKPPTFWCVEGEGELLYIDRNTGIKGDMWNRCKDYPGGPLQGMHGTSYIAVCPRFWTLSIPDTPPEGHCPLVRNTKFKGTGANLALFRIWLVMHELVQFYLYFITGSEIEVWDINDAISLGGKASARNTRNYIYYAAMIHGKCTNYPRLPIARPPDRELLGTLLNHPANGTGAAAADAVPIRGTVVLGGEIDFGA